jgi:hypothetical protein
MKLLAVAILAMVVGTGCGLEPGEDPDAPVAVHAGEQGLEQEPGGARTNTGQTGVTTLPTPPRDPSLVALPQDPIPVFEQRPVFPGSVTTTLRR